MMKIQEKFWIWFLSSKTKPHKIYVTAGSHLTLTDFIKLWGFTFFHAD